MKLNRSLVIEANRIFWDRHPQMRGKQIDTNKQPEYAKEWWEIYNKLLKGRERRKKGGMIAMLWLFYYILGRKI
ncbi:MAG: hypothetical protein ACTSQY_11770 [Candidatus Odinarchaeia archaeon]